MCSQEKSVFEIEYLFQKTYYPLMPRILNPHNTIIYTKNVIIYFFLFSLRTKTINTYTDNLPKKAIKKRKTKLETLIFMGFYFTWTECGKHYVYLRTPTLTTTLSGNNIGHLILWYSLSKYQGHFLITKSIYLRTILWQSYIRVTKQKCSDQFISPGDSGLDRVNNLSTFYSKKVIWFSIIRSTVQIFYGNIHIFFSISHSFLYKIIGSKFNVSRGMSCEKLMRKIY